MGKQYKLYTNAAGTNNGVASLKITKAGRIRAIYFSLAALGGAGVCRLNYEVSKQNTISNTTNDTPETVLASAFLPVGNGVHVAENVTVMCDLAVQIGDTIYLNLAFTGAVAPSSAECQIYLYT